MTRTPRAIALSVLAVVGGLACRRAPPAAGPAMLTIALRADVTGIFPEPSLFNEAFTINLNANLFEGLVRFNRHLEVEPALAERWESPDERTTIFVLRPGMRFSDGRALTAFDVAASLLAAQERQWVTRGYLQAIESARALDDRRVEVRTRSPYPNLIHKLHWGFVLPAAAIAASAVPPIGSGAYRLVDRQPGREFTFERNPYFRGPAAPFGRVRFVVMPDASTRIDALRRGEVDLIDSVPVESVERLREAPDVRVISRPSTRVLLLALRVDQTPFADPRVREAVDLALDREELIRRTLAGHAQPASQLVPREVFGFDPALPFTRSDRGRARRLLAEAGHRNGLEIRLDGTNNRYLDDRAILDEIARQLGEVGIRAQVNALDKRDFFPLIHSTRSKLHMIGWICESGDAGDALDALVHSPSPNGLLGVNNTMGFADADLDRLIDRSNDSRTRVERAAALRAALHRAAELRPLIPLLVPPEIVAFSRRISWDPPSNFGLNLHDIAPAE